MKTCFVIMPFTTELNSIYEQCYEPVIKSNNLMPVVLNRTRDGSPVYSQIIANIQNGYLVIADLTIARPNCYFEVGYAIGQGKQDQLIMCCREDHLTDDPENPRQSDKIFLLFNLVRSFLPTSLDRVFSNYFRPMLDQHKIHFDLAGYNVIWWNVNKKDDLIVALDEEIKQRMKILEAKTEKIDPQQTADKPNLSKQQPAKEMTESEIKARLDKIGQDQEKELGNVKN